MNYELTLVVDPKISDNEREGLVNDFKKHASESVEKVDDWGRKQLAYSLQKNPTAQFLHLTLASKKSTLPKELNKALRLEKRVLRYLLVKKD